MKINTKLFFGFLIIIVPTNVIAIIAFFNIEENPLQYVVIIIAIGATGAGSVIVLRFYRSLKRQITNLKIASTLMDKGKFKREIKITGNDEFTELTRNFNKMALTLTLTEQRLQKSILELEKIDQMKEEFVSMVSHELKTPLMPILGFCELLQDEKSYGDLTEKQREMVSTIIKNTEKLETLIDDVLQVHKLDLKKLKTNKEEIELKEFLEETIEGLSQYALKSNAKIYLEIDGSWKIFFDPKRITQVISNLVKNSLDFVPENGRVTIKAQRLDQETLFTVEDNGTGIDPKHADNLFKKFYQIDSSLKRSFGGTGLGLTICQGLVEAHGGKIWLDKEYTQGASFKFVIPFNSAS